METGHGSPRSGCGTGDNQLKHNIGSVLELGVFDGVHTVSVGRRPSESTGEDKWAIHRESADHMDNAKFCGVC